MQRALAAQLPWSSSPWLLCWDVSSVSSSISSSSSSSSSCGEGRSTASVAGGGCMGERYKWDIFRAGSSAATAQLPSTPTAGRDNLFQLAVPPCSSCLCWWSLRTWLPCSHLPALNSQRRTCWMVSQHFLTLWKAQKPITVCQGALNLRSYPGSLLAPAHPRAPPLTPSSYETGAAGPGSPAGA